MNRMIKRAKDKLARVGSATKGAVVAVGSTVGATVSHAQDVVYTEASGFTGTFNLTPFYSAVAIIVVAIAVVASIKLALGMFKKVA
jgi:anti-sigma-K factor RskA